VSKLWRRPGTAQVTEDQVNARVARARADVARILDRILDDDEGLAEIYAMHGQQAPASRPGPVPADDEGGQVQAVCDRIAMLETALARASAPGVSSSTASMYLGMARRFLVELRSGLANRTVSAEDAARLMGSVRHDLREADRTLDRERQLPLKETVLTRIGEMRDLTRDLVGQVDALDDQVMRLFGHSDDPAVVPVPQY
jgi:hypothetical protein